MPRQIRMDACTHTHARTTHGRRTTRIHQTEVVTTMSCSPQTGWTKNKGKGEWYSSRKASLPRLFCRPSQWLSALCSSKASPFRKTFIAQGNKNTNKRAMAILNRSSELHVKQEYLSRS